MTPKRRARLLYIAGSGRSGSTLVERALGAAPRCVNVGELIELFRKPAVASERCGCGKPFERCEFWSEVTGRAFGGWSTSTLAEVGSLQRRISRQRFVPRLLTTDLAGDSSFARRLREYGAAYDAVYDAIAGMGDADTIIDASKWPGQALALRRSLDRPISLLHLVRDARGVAYSWAKTSVRRPHAGDQVSVLATHSPASTARRWVAFEVEIGLIQLAFESSSRMRYEDFVKDPRSELTRVQAELGLGLTPDDFRHVGPDYLELTSSHGVAGNPSRFGHGIVGLRPDDEWTRRFDDRNRRLVTAMTAPWLVRNGYPLIRPKFPSEEVSSDASTPQGTTGGDDPRQGRRSWPLVDVVIPTRGRPDLVRQAVSSVIAQDYAGPISVVVVHDAEEPQTQLTTLTRKGRTVRVAGNTHAPGLAGARNAGLELTTADYIASCDDDDTWAIDKLRRQMTRMLAEPDLMVLGAGIRLLMAPHQVVDWPGDSAVITREQLLRSRRKELHSSTLLIRREVFESVGPYDEQLPSSYAEDYEFLLRAVEVGRIGVVNVPLASILKYNSSWFRERAEVVAEGLEYLLDKHPQIAESRRGHARVLGQIAFARSTLGERAGALSTAGQAIRRWPLAPHAALAVTHALTGIDPRVLLRSVRKVGRGIT